MLHARCVVAAVCCELVFRRVVGVPLMNGGGYGASHEIVVEFYSHKHTSQQSHDSRPNFCELLEVTVGVSLERKKVTVTRSAIYQNLKQNNSVPPIHHNS